MRKYIFIVLAFAGLAFQAQAHPLLQNAMWVQSESNQIRLAINVSLREIDLVQNLPANADLAGNPGPSDATLEHQGDYVLKHLSIAAGTTRLAGRLVSFTRPPAMAGAEQTFFQFDFAYPLAGPPPAELTMNNHMLKEIPHAAGTPWNVSYVIRVKRAGANPATSWLLAGDQPAIIPTGWGNAGPPALASATMIAAATTPDARTLGEYLRAGIMHILTGWDHLLFVSALVIATRNFWEMVKVVAAFTLAHSLTLALCVFGIFRLPAGVVEPVIALSIIFVALENLLWPGRARSRIRLAVAFGFGLVHGLGYAGGLLDAMAGLPAIGTWIALVAFSLGVEIGHQIVVLPGFGLLSLSRHKLADGFQARMLRYGSTVISCCGAYYLVATLNAQVFNR
jgi:hydrogenase/urease accessory protein HupE